MRGKVKMKGNMSLAMQLSRLFELDMDKLNSIGK
jgi:hypothetical protein